MPGQAENVYQHQGNAMQSVTTFCTVTDQRKKRGKVASAHDLRRVFDTRWARMVMPAVLKDLMRHKDISPTMQHYVDLDAESTADELWSVFGATCGATGESSEHADSENPYF